MNGKQLPVLALILRGWQDSNLLPRLRRRGSVLPGSGRAANVGYLLDVALLRAISRRS
jgi:hypothetical protein